MHLTHTAELLCRRLEDGVFDDYAVLVGIGGQEQLLTSPAVNRDTYFDVASMGKVLVTSTLILRALGERRLSLAHRLDRFFAAVPDEKKAITLQQLLTHTSGIVRIPISAEIADRGTDAVAAHILANPLAYRPGSNYIYSCNGYILLGFILEKIYGQPLNLLFEQYLKAPLQLTRRRFNIAVDEENAAICYSRTEVGLYRTDDSNVCNMRGVAGSGASFWTAADLQKFILAVLEKSPLLYPEPLFALAERDYTPDFSEGRGLGYLIADERYPQTGLLFPNGSFGHCGHTGMSFFVHRNSGLYAIILTNATRCANRRSGWKGYDYGEVMKMRADIHNEIRRDLSEQRLL